MTDKIHCAVQKATTVHSGYISAEYLMKNALKTKTKKILKPDIFIPCHAHHTQFKVNCNCHGKYTGCNRRNGPDFGRVFLMLNYTEKLQNNYIQS
jgi:ribosomal protein L31